MLTPRAESQAQITEIARLREVSLCSVTRGVSHSPLATELGLEPRFPNLNLVFVPLLTLGLAHWFFHLLPH